MSFDERTNTLLVSDIPSKIAEIRQLVAVLDRPVQQVLIESRIVIATDSFARELGVKFGVSGGYEDGNGNVVSTSGSAAATDAMSNIALNNRLGTPGRGDAYLGHRGDRNRGASARQPPQREHAGHESRRQLVSRSRRRLPARSRTVRSSDRRPQRGHLKSARDHREPA